MLPADRWPVLGDRVMEAAPNLTYFEFLTALGLLASPKREWISSSWKRGLAATTTPQRPCRYRPSASRP
ncbi:MAG: hypothetical protein ACLT2T_01710 [Bilophila wadsworthia]